MSTLRAFVGHSFDENDLPLIDVFLKYFDSLRDIGFEWDSAKKAQLKELSDQVKEKMEGKNLFIGIFTLKDRQIHDSKLEKTGIFKKDRFSGQIKDFSWNTSDWIIQESGYALGKGMKTLFIIEEGLDVIGGLQGDLQYIPFSRKYPSKSFTEINEMITALLKKEPEAKVSEDIQEKPNVILPEGSTSDDRTKADEQEKQDYFKELLAAIKNGEESKEKKLLEKNLQETAQGDKYKEINFVSFYHWLRYKYGNKNVLQDLLKLSKDNPEHPMPNLYLGKLYEEYKNHDKAKEYFLTSAKLSNNMPDNINFMCRAAESLRYAKKYNEGKELLLELFKNINPSSYQEQYELFKSLANIELDETNFDNYFALAEKALDLNPSDETLRFEVANNYYQKARHELSLYHYKILCDTSPNTANWNNLGVEFTELNLNGKAVSAYKKSEEMGDTTSVGNLAHKLIDAGFLEEARSRLEAILKKEKCASNVPSALASIERVYKAENEKEKELLQSIETEQSFRIRYADAYSSTDEIKSLAPTWKSKYGNVKVIIQNNKFKAVGEEVISLSGLLSLMNPYRKEPAEKRKQIIEYSGTIVNRAIDYKLSIQTVPLSQPDRSTLAGSLLSEMAEVNKKGEVYSGHMVVNHDDKEIIVMEKDSKGKLAFYSLLALE
jgi:hypothetical protein